MILNQVNCCILLVIGMVLGTTATVLPTEDSGQLYCSFSKGAWNPEDWFFVSLRDLPGTNKWIQKDGFIANDGNTISMLLKKKFKGDLMISSTMAFADLQAPTIFIATKLGDLPKGGKEYDEDLEITLWHEGINVWRHTMVNGKSVFAKVAYYQFKLLKDTKYKLQVIKKGKEFSITVADHAFGYLADWLPEDFYAGIMACEGVNSFYDFTIQTAKAAK